MADLKAQIEITADASGVEAGVSQGKRALKELGEAGKRAGEEANKGIGGIGDNGNESAQKVDRATKNIISSIQRTTAAMEAGSRGTSDYYKVVASQRGANTDALKPYLDQLDKAIIKQQQAAKSLGNVGISAGQTAAALRGVPAQFTDIVTSLQGGQAPMTVLLQQGGQLKDMFGGVGNAAKAMGGYVLGLINPITIAAGAAAAIGIAFKSGSEEANGLAKALILTGNAANTSVDQLKNVATAVTASSGATKGAVMDALTQIAETGQVSAKSMGVVAAAAIAMEKAGGQAISETVKQAAELGKEPVKASIKLNEQYNYLTAKVYEQIKAFEDQGRATEAAALAQETYAKAMEERARSITGELGALEKAWKGITGTAKSAWDAMLGIGREGSIEERLAAARKDLAAGGGMFGGEGEARAKIAVLEAQQEAQKKALDTQTKGNSLERAKLAWMQEGEKYLSKQQQREQEIAKARQQGLAAGASQLEIEKRIAEISDKYKDPKSPAAKDPLRGRDHNERVSELTKEADTELDGLVKIRKERQAAAEASQYLADIQSKFNRSNASKSDSLLILPENVARLNTELRNVDQTAEDAKNRLAKMFGDGKLNADDYAAKLAELNSLTATQKEAVVGLNERQNALNSSWEYGAEKAMQKYADSAQNVAAQTESVFNSAFGSMEEALVRFAQTGKLNFSSLANSIIADILRVRAKAAISGLADIVSGFFKTPTAGASSGNTTPGYSSGDLGSGIRLANGGVFNSPSLSAYSGGVYATPQPFTFAKGAGIFGEAGPEAIMPLKRGTDGKLGVAAQVSGNNMVVNIQPPAGHQAKTQERTDGQGNKVVDVLFEQFESRLAGNIASGNGSVPAAMSGAYGLNRRAGAY